MANRQRTEGQARRDFIKLCASIALIVSAFTFTFGGLFRGSVAGNILDLIAKLALLVAIGFPAYFYSRGLGKAWRIIFWIALVIYVAGCVLGMFSINLGAN